VAGRDEERGSVEAVEAGAVFGRAGFDEKASTTTYSSIDAHHRLDVESDAL
jgi:hypothetical protein